MQKKNKKQNKNQLKAIIPLPLVIINNVLDLSP